MLIRTGPDEIPALTFAGLRYAVAFLLLLPPLARGAACASLTRLTGRDWALLAALAVVMYALPQGAQFLGLERLPAQTTSLVLSFTPAMVAAFGMFVLAERPSRRQGCAVALFLVGAVTFLYPVAFPRAELIGLAIAIVVGLVPASLGTLVVRLKAGAAPGRPSATRRDA